MSTTSYGTSCNAKICFRIVVSFDLNENTNQDESALDEDAEDEQQYAEDDHEIMGKVRVKFSGRVLNHQLKQQSSKAAKHNCTVEPS